jgi:hypothetical protein
MIIKLEEKLTDLLLKQPESGMGYQKIDITLKDGRIIGNVIVFIMLKN